MRLWLCTRRPLVGKRRGIERQGHPEMRTDELVPSDFLSDTHLVASEARVPTLQVICGSTC